MRLKGSVVQTSLIVIVLLCSSSVFANENVRVCVEITEHAKKQKSKIKKTISIKPKKTKVKNQTDNSNSPVQMKEAQAVEGSLKQSSTNSQIGKNKPKENLDKGFEDSPINSKDSNNPVGPLQFPPKLNNKPTIENQSVPRHLTKQDSLPSAPSKKKKDLLGLLKESKEVVIQTEYEGDNTHQSRFNNQNNAALNHYSESFYSASSHIPKGQSALIYLKRLTEHFITHEKGFVAVENQCQQTVKIELYPLTEGWTAFARYSGTNREEKVDQLLISELSPFAERVATALLKDVSIEKTINRENVLTSDSKKNTRTISGTNHFVLNVGTQLRIGRLNQVIKTGDQAGRISPQYRLFNPMKFHMGYRGRFQNWGIETMAHIGFGMGRTNNATNVHGGHIDYGGDTGIAMHFIKYFKPKGITSFYLGAGSTFELLWLYALAPQDSGDNRDTLISGGLDVDGIFGWEFMRATAVSFFLQGEINLPAYVIRTESEYGSIHTWMPGMTMKLGVVF